MEGKDFTESEVRRKLAELGYHDIPKDQMKVFMQDLNELIRHEASLGSEYDTSATGENDLTSDSHQIKDQKRYAISRYKTKPSSRSQVYDDLSLDKENFGYDQQFRLREASSVSSLSSSGSVNANLDSSNVSTVTRRKVARKRDGMTRVFDETFQEEDSEASDITLLEERLRSLPLRDDYDECQTDDSASMDSTSTRARSERGFLPSYIRPSTSRSIQGRSQKFDPVSRYHQFKEEWKLQGVPGESRHDALRWSVKEQMLNCQIYERPQHNHRPNNYQVPTKKKRQALRWEVRCALAKI